MTGMLESSPGPATAMVLSAASGGGHVRAAEALVSAFDTQAVFATHLEVLEHCAPLLRRLYADYYVKTVNRHAWLLGLAYGAMGSPQRFRRARLLFDLLQTRRLASLLCAANPGVILCTHFLPAEIVVHLRRKGLLTGQVGVVMTDFDVHALWLYPDVDWYFVAGPEGRARLEGFGIAPERIHATGIPIDPAFALPASRSAVRVSMGLSPELPTVLLSAGGFGIGPVEALFGALQRVRQPIQIIAVCGRNEELARRIQRKAAAPSHRTRVVGHTEKMDAFMSAADLLIGKAGGLTCAEALARGVVPVLAHPIPGPEQRNAAILVKEGAAVRCDDGSVTTVVERLLEAPELLARLRQAGQRTARPLAALQIASIVSAARRGSSCSARTSQPT